MINKLQSFCFLLVLFIAANGNAQKTDIGNWFLYLGNQKINNRWILVHRTTSAPISALRYDVDQEIKVENKS